MAGCRGCAGPVGVRVTDADRIIVRLAKKWRLYERENRELRESSSPRSVTTLQRIAYLDSLEQSAIHALRGAIDTALEGEIDGQRT